MEPYHQTNIIEFCGLPGSGKSTIARALSFSRENISEVYFYSDILRKNEKLCLLNPFYLFLFVRLIILSFVSFHCCSIKQIYGMVVILFNYSNIEKKYRGTIIVEQGIIQKILSIGHLDKINEKTAKKFLSIALAPYQCKLKYVHVECNIKEAIRRLQNRGYEGARLNNYCGSKLHQAMQLQDDNLRVIKKVITDNYPSIQCINLDSIHPIIESVEIVSNYI